MSTRSMRRIGAVLVLVLLFTALIVPAASAAPSEGSGPQDCRPIYYRVVRGDNLTSIAYRYGTSVWQLQRWNNIWNVDRIYVGQSLIVGYRCRPHDHKPPPPPPPPPGSPWLAQYFNNKDLSGAPVLQLSYPSLGFNWGWNSPAPGVQADNFSARFTNLSNVSGGTYRITLRTDDGARVYVDNMLVIDAWRVQPVTGYFVDVAIPRGLHTFTVEYFENDQLAELSLTVVKR